MLTPSLKSTATEALFWYVLIALSFVVLIQSYRETVSSIFFFALVEMGITPHILILVTFLAPLLAYPISRLAGWRTSVMVLGSLVLLTRLPMGFGSEQPIHLAFSTISFGASSMLLPLLFALHRRERCFDPDLFSSQALAGSFSLSLLSIILLSIPGRGVDISLVPGACGPVLSPAISAVICGGMAFSLHILRNGHLLDRSRDGAGSPGDTVRGGAADSWAPGIGLGAALFISSTVIAQPIQTAAWLGTDHSMTATFSVVTISLFVLSLLSGPWWLTALRRTLAHPKYSIGANLVLVLAAVNIFVLGVPLQTAPAVITWIMLVDVWVIFDALTDNAPFSGSDDERPQTERGSDPKRFIWNRTMDRRSPLVFTVQMVFSSSVLVFLTVLLSIADQWSFVPFGELLKDTVPEVHIASFIMLGISGFMCSKAAILEPASVFPPPLERKKGSPTIDAGRGAGHLRARGAVSSRLRSQWLMFGAAATVLMLLSMGSGLVIRSDGPSTSKLVDTANIRVASYNVHHGFCNDGRVDPTPHLEVLRDIDADIIFLQESRSLLPAEGGFDPALYLAGRLGMHLVRGGGPELGDEGLAVLSKFMLRELTVMKMPYTDVPRTALVVRADLGDRELWLMNVHMGLEAPERAEQIEWIAVRTTTIASERWPGLPFIIGGDLNTEPDDPMMGRLNSTVLGDGRWNTSTPSLGLRSAWHSVPPTSRNRVLDHHTFPSSAYDLPKEHIDYILLSQGLEPFDSWIGDGAEASDHRPIWADIRVL
jgi:endonuclease/exonuclease/phosphatase family metal-dependent hydrolase